MKRCIKLLGLAFCCISNIDAQNPIVSHCYTADPAPVVYEGNDSLYVYCDEDMNISGVHDFYYMERWRVYSTVDMVNWTDHGIAMPRTAFTWGREGTCWASQCVKRGDNYYWYMCISKPNDWRHYIGVGKSSSPSGPFKDAYRKPIIDTGTGGDIDPTVFIDDDDQAYMYWGNKKLSYVKLSATMLLYNKTIGNKGIVDIPLTTEAFGGYVKDEKIVGKDCYEEGPWLDKRGDWYYLIYAAGGVPEHISYSMSRSPEGPWEYKGHVMDEGGTGSFTNHSGMVHYKGKDYFFYHTAWAPGGGGFNRSMSVEEMFFNADGTIQKVKPTRQGVKALCTMNPYIRQQAETINSATGISVVGNESTGVYVTGITSKSQIKVANLDFANEAPASITLRIATAANAGSIILRQDTPTGSIIARYSIKSTGGDDQWQEVTVPLTKVPSGVHAICFTFTGTGTNLCNFDWWKFNTHEEVSINGITSSSASSDYYDLCGRKVAKPQKGVYIHNGKKVLK